MTTTIQRAVLTDVDEVARLFDQYRSFYECPSDPAFARTYIHDRLAAEESVVFVARDDDGRAVGFTQLYSTFCSVEGGPIFVLYDLFVAPAARGTGIGRALMERAEAHARSAGAIRLDLSTAIDNTIAQALYESRGWERDQRFYHYSLALR